MKDVAKRTRELFPDLTFCELIDRNGSIENTANIDVLNDFQPAKNWISWFFKSTEKIEWLRVNLTDQSQLYFKKLTDDYYLIAYNQIKNAIQLIKYFESIDLSLLSKDKKNTKTVENTSTPDPKMMEAVRIQNMIIPNEDDIKKQFRQFFVVHEQQDFVGGDFYWCHTIGEVTLLAIIDCTGHSLEGAMTSMVCNSLLNQSVEKTQSVDPLILLREFYKLLEKYNMTTQDILDYGIGAEMGLFSFDKAIREFSFASTGIAAFVKRNNVLEQLKVKRLLDYSQFDETVKKTTHSMEDIDRIYSFTDGLPDQFNSADNKKLGRKGVIQMIANEGQFSADYYQNEIAKWKGDNIQYDDITLVGLAL